MKKLFFFAVALVVFDGPWAAVGARAQVTFNMVVSAGAAACLPGATATVTITPLGPVEQMDVQVSGLPANAEFDFFVIQLPQRPLASPGIRVTSRPTETGMASRLSSVASTSRRSSWPNPQVTNQRRSCSTNRHSRMRTTTRRPSRSIPTT